LTNDVILKILLFILHMLLVWLGCHLNSLKLILTRL